MFPENPAEIISVQDLYMQLARIDVLPWTMKDIDDNKTFKLEFNVGAHGIAKLSVIVKAGLDFTICVYFAYPLYSLYLR